MNTMNFATIAPYVIGRHGKYFPQYGGADRVFLYGIFWNHKNLPDISPQSAKKYINGSARFHRGLLQQFGTPAGFVLLHANIQRMVACSPCISHLVEVQTNLFSFLNSCTLTAPERQRLATAYVADSPTPDQIAFFLASAIHIAIRHSYGCVPFQVLR